MLAAARLRRGPQYFPGGQPPGPPARVVAGGLQEIYPRGATPWNPRVRLWLRSLQEVRLRSLQELWLGVLQEAVRRG